PGFRRAEVDGLGDETESTQLRRNGDTCRVVRPAAPGNCAQHHRVFRVGDVWSFVVGGATDDGGRFAMKPTWIRGGLMALLLLPVRDDLKLVSISVDPERDTPAMLANYAAENHADRTRWWFLTGDKAEVKRLSRETFKLLVVDGAETIDHSSKFVLVDRNGAI